MVIRFHGHTERPQNWHLHQCPTCEHHFECRCVMGRERDANCAECGAAANEAADLSWERDGKHELDSRTAA